MGGYREPDLPADSRAQIAETTRRPPSARPRARSLCLVDVCRLRLVHRRRRRLGVARHPSPGHPEPASDFIVAYVVLALAFVLEGISFAQALRQAHKGAERYNRHTLEYVVFSSNPTLRAVFAEDLAALIGIGIAATGIALHQITGSAIPDAIGSILVGLLLGTIAVVLIDRNRKFLVGEPATGNARTAVVTLLLQRPEVDRVTYLHMEFVGPSRLYVVAAVDLTGDRPEHDVAVALRRLEHELEEHELIEEAVLTLATSDEQPLLGE